MTIQVTGTLVDPTGSPLSNSKIRITALETSETLASACAERITDAVGIYDFNLVDGKYSLEINQKSKYNRIAHIEVTPLTTTPITVEDLIESYAFCEVEAPTCPV